VQQGVIMCSDAPKKKKIMKNRKKIIKKKKKIFQYQE